MKIKNKLTLLTGLQLLVLLFHQSHILINIHGIRSRFDPTNAVLSDLTTGIELRFAILRFFDLKYDNIFQRGARNPEIASLTGEVEEKFQHISNASQKNIDQDEQSVPRDAAIHDQYRQLIRLLSSAEEFPHQKQRLELSREASDFSQQTLLRTLNVEISTEADNLEKIYQDLMSRSGSIPMLKADLNVVPRFLEEELFFLTNLIAHLQLFLLNGKIAIIQDTEKSRESYYYFEGYIVELLSERRSREQWRSSPYTFALSSRELKKLSEFFQSMRILFRKGLTRSDRPLDQRFMYIQEYIVPKEKQFETTLFASLEN